MNEPKRTPWAGTPDEEHMRRFWEGMGVDEETGIHMLQQMGWMDADAGLTELGVAEIKALILEQMGGVN
jgi:hypothetical protein